MVAAHVEPLQLIVSLLNDYILSYFIVS